MLYRSVLVSPRQPQNALRFLSSPAGGGLVDGTVAYVESTNTLDCSPEWDVVSDVLGPCPDCEGACRIQLDNGQDTLPGSSAHAELAPFTSSGRSGTGYDANAGTVSLDLGSSWFLWTSGRFDATQLTFSDLRPTPA